jgi:hypothetical protein
MFFKRVLWSSACPSTLAVTVEDVERLDPNSNYFLAS